MRQSISLREQKIDQYLLRLKGQDVPQDVASDLCRFGTISVCGHLEQCVQIVILDRLSQRANLRVLNFVKSYFKKGQNFKCEDIVVLFERFENEWAKNLKLFLEQNDEVVSAVDSLYSIRNPLAHGASGSIGNANLEKYFSSVKLLTEAMIMATEGNVRRRRR